MFKVFRGIKRLLGIEHYKVFKKAVTVLCCDAIIHAVIFSMMFLVIIDIINSKFTMNKVIIYSIITVVTTVVRFFVLRKGLLIDMKDAADGIAYLRVKMGDYISGFGMGYFNSNNIGNLTNIVTNDMRDFEQLTTHLIPFYIKNGILMVYLLACVLIVNVELGIYQALVFLINIPLMIHGGKKINIVGYEGKKVRSNMISKIIEYVQGIEVFKGYNMLGESFQELKSSLNDVRKESIRIELAGVPYILAMGTLVFLSLPILVYVAVVRYSNGAMDGSQLLIYIVLSLAFTSVSMAFYSQYVEAMYFMISVEKLNSILDMKQISYEIEEHEFKNFNIEFKDVDFAYIEENQVLRGINFTAKEHQTTALVGPSGSGKSTILNLIARFWDVDNGSIKIDGLDIKKLKPDSLLKNISMVFQDVYLIEDTIFENIKIGNSQASKEDVIEAAKKAHCHEFIMELQEGYDTMVFEGGDSLSGGEKQRISIARAFLKDAPIILLDEATASLDVDNEYLIQHAFRELTKNKTVLIIAHRLNTIKDSEQIVVFDEGQVIEKGSHNELMKNKGKYEEMFNELMRAKEWVL